jgi:hypothetical protein
MDPASRMVTAVLSFLTLETNSGCSVGYASGRQSLWGTGQSNIVDAENNET